MLDVTALLTYALMVYMQIDSTTIPTPCVILQHHDTLSKHPLLLPDRAVPPEGESALRRLLLRC